MLDRPPSGAFPMINAAYGAVFRPGRLSLGLVAPLEAYAVGAAPTMTRHLETARLADRLGFAALWLRDVPFDVPSFGDPGQMFDPFVYLGALATATERIALGTASVILPLRHPAHVAKAAASADVLSGGRLLLGVASGDRPEEYPALNMGFEDRGERFRESYDYIRAMAEAWPHRSGPHGDLDGRLDMLPKPSGPRLPLLVTGGSRQSPDWVAEHGDGWITYPRAAAAQGEVVADYRRRTAAAGAPDKPVMQSLYVDLAEDDDEGPSPIHLGFRSGPAFLRGYLEEVQALGVNHVALNLRFNRAPVEPTMQRLAETLLPHFS
ncbi:MAG: LLM class oxidoreductase [Pseudomonadota bacterium]